MKLNRLVISNYQIVSDVDLELGSRPIFLIAGPNEQGKTSISDAAYTAFTGKSLRVPLKKDFAQLVRDGAKKGQVSLEWDGGKARVNLPSGAHLSEGTIPPAIEYVLLANRFADLDPDARRAFLFKLLGAKIGVAELTRRLTLKKHAAEKISACGLSAGAETAHKLAKAKAAESRGAWKALTNEAYGETKGATWAPAPVAFDPETLAIARTTLATAEAKVADLTQQMGAYRIAKETAERQAKHIEGLRERASHHARHVAKLTTDEAELTACALKLEEARAAAAELGGKKAPADLAALVDIAEEVLALVGKTQLVSTLSGEIVPWDDGLITCIQNAIDQHKATYGTGAEPSVATRELAARVGERETAYNLMKNAVQNDRRDLSLSELAAKELAELPEGGQTAVPKSPEAELAIARADLQPIKMEVSQLEALERAATKRETLIAQAFKHHTDVLEWEALADDLAPDGIPGELLADALRPFNDRLRATAEATGWPQVRIDGDMTLTMDGRGYHLGSESARWRANAAIAEAVSHLSGTKILVIDRMDVLDLPNRAAFMGWIDALAEAGEIDTALIFATLKELPRGFPDSWALRWIENGVLYDNTNQPTAQQAA